MDNHQEEINHAGAQSRAGEAGANLTDVLAATVERDAARYRWLRNEVLQDATIKPFGIAVAILDKKPNENGNYNIIGWAVTYEEDADAAIDAAMAANFQIEVLPASGQSLSNAGLDNLSEERKIMYYEEKIINGVLHCRTTPNGEWRQATTVHAAVVNALMSLTDEQRMDAFRFFCTHCGVDDPRCQCWNDE